MNLGNSATTIDRPVFSQKQFEAEYSVSDSKSESKNVFKKHVKKFLHQYHPKHILSLFTVLNLISEYRFRDYLIGDIISGLTVGILNIPTSLAYSVVITLNPIFGLYSSFFPSMTYILFCTSRHLSVGPFAIVSIMIYSTVFKLESKYVDIALGNNSTNLDELIQQQIVNDTRLKIVTSLSFWCGIIQITFAVLKFGSLTKYFSQPLLRGFTTAGAFHILSAQLQNAFGVRLTPTKARFFKIFRIIWQIAKNYMLINWISVAITISGFLFIYIVKTYISDKYKKQMKNIPIPAEFIVLVVSILVAHFIDMKEIVPVVGYIPKGFPSPAIPDPTLFFDVLPDALIISLVIFATSISISDLYARKHKYKINSNQEMFSLGICNLAGSFFSCFPVSGTLARTAVQEESGGKTQLVTVVANVVILLVMFYLSPLLQILPKACLSAIIISALVNLLKRLTDATYYWNLDKIDFTVWMLTFLASLIIDIDYGLWIGIIALLFLNTYRSQRMNLIELGQVENFTDVQADINRYKANEIDGVKVIRLTHSLFYINSDYMRKELNRLCPLKEKIEEKTICENCYSNCGCFCRKENGGSEDLKLPENVTLKDKCVNQEIKYYDNIILDFSLVQFIDESGVKCLKDIYKEYKNDNVKILLINCNDEIISFFKKMKSFKGFFDEITYLTLYDALKCIRYNNNDIV